ncbi:MAG: c-type cytochrome [Hyphomicrobiales bacterium]|nr:c-type cytochrome [Hyphomicrobiales bacterium]
MTGRLAAALCAVMFAPVFGQADEARPRPDVGRLPISANATAEEVALGDRIFHGEAAGGTCFQCHGWDAKGTTNGNDLTVGSLGWGESFSEIKATIKHNMAVAPGQDGDLTPADVHAVTAYVWGLVHQERIARQAQR